MAKLTKQHKPRRLATKRRPANQSPSATVVQLANLQRRHAIKKQELCDAVGAIIIGEKAKGANISIVIVDDATIHRLNREFLDHDEPTDALSFLFESTNGYVDGEIIASADTAARAAKQFGWKFADELLLYVIHATLHLFGYDDQSAAKRRTMRQRERFYLNQFGRKPQHANATLQ